MYAPWWSDTITLYNKYEDPQTGVITWYRTVLSKCFWKASGQKVKVGQVELESDTILCRIPKNSKYMSKFAWVALPNDRMASYFTLSQGDIVIKGEIDDDINEYVSGKRSSDFLTKYRYYERFVIENVADNTGEGRGIPHYYISGV